MNKNFKLVVEKIKKYDYIVIARHLNSDLDALGSQFGLKEWINLNFKNKKVYCVGENHSKYTYKKKFIPESDKIDFENVPYLAICVDVNQLKRTDGGKLFEKADYTICIDHHNPLGADKFDYMYVDSKSISCAQIIADFMLSCKFKKMNTNVCKYLFSGIASDSGHFFYEACDYKTFEIASKLLKIGKFNAYNDIFYIVDMNSLEDSKLVNNLFSKIVYDKDSGLAYYINSAQDLKELGVSASSANEKIASFNRIEEFEIILAASEDTDGLYRCSIRSKVIPIVEVAQKYGGGGHKFASGAKGLDKEKLLAMIDDLKKLKKI